MEKNQITFLQASISKAFHQFPESDKLEDKNEPQIKA